MTADLLQNIDAHGALFDLSTRAKWQLSGGDRMRYLNGQVTNDVRRASTDEALYACVTDVKGRIVGDIHIHAHDEALCFDAEPELREILGPRLERYIIADDAELTDISEDWQLWHLCGPEALAALDAMPMPEGARRIHNNRLATPGLDLWLPAHSPFPTSNFQCSKFDVGSSMFDVLRILRAIPRYPHELGPDTFPPEAGLETSAMSFTKGCYIGQEVLSRIKTTGKMPRVLVRWQASELVRAGDEWYAEASDARIGHATSAAFHPGLQRWVGLGVVKQASAALDSELLVRNAQPRIGPLVEISALLN